MTPLPTPKASTEAEARLVLVLACLTSDWQDQAELIARVGIYPPKESSSRRMLPRDMRALIALGFEVERSGDHKAPQWRIVGHARFGKETRTRFCTRCRQWRDEAQFGKNLNEVSGAARYCLYCMRTQQNTRNMRKRIARQRQGWRRKLDMRRYHLAGRAGKRTEIAGRAYPSQAAAARALGVSRQAINQRRRTRRPL